MVIYDLNNAEPLENEQSILDMIDEKIEKKDTGVVIAERLNLRLEPSFDADVITILSKNDTVIIEDSVGDFYRVLASDISGYCAKEFITIK